MNPSHPKRQRRRTVGDPGSTLASVAAAAGVSTATVSRYFSDPDLLGPQARERVREVVQQLGFVPNRLAGGLASRRTRLVAAAIPTVTNQIFASTIQSLTEMLADQGYDVLLAVIGANNEYADRQIDTIIGHRPNGIILTGTTLGAPVRARLAASRIPTIETWDLPLDPIDMVVGFSHEAVGRALGRHALGAGRRRALLVSGRGPHAQARSRGVMAEWDTAGLAHQVHAATPAPSTYRHGREAVGEGLTRDALLDVVICSSDWEAHGAMDELRRRGRAVPGDVSVLGFGDLDFAADLDPPLTTVRIDGAAIGRQAAGFLLRRSRGLRVPGRTVDVGFDLVIRGT